jgi:diguanylate cyclase (GGDEF)-like protein
VVLLGERERSERYPAEELELLSLLSHLVATTFENARLFESATYEGLTGLFRRETIIEHLHSEVARAQRYGRPLTVGMADLDHFKQVNDRFGHLVGDAVLQRVARTIAAALRGTDSVGRYGGEEFLLVLPETSLDEGLRVAEKVRELVQELSTTADDGREVRVTISIGLASLDNLDPALGIDATDLIAVADSNLYAAKSAGRNRIEVKLAT